MLLPSPNTSPTPKSLIQHLQASSDAASARLSSTTQSPSDESTIPLYPPSCTECHYDVRREASGVLALFSSRGRVWERIMTIDEPIFPNISMPVYRSFGSLCLFSSLFF